MTTSPVAADSRVPALDGLRGLASLALFNLAFLSNYVETGFYVPDGAGFPGRLAAKALLAGVYTGVVAMDLLFILSGYFLYKALLTTPQRPLAMLWRRYRRFLPLYLMVSIPAFVYSGAGLRDIVGHVALLDLYNFGAFVYQISSQANYYLYFAFVCVALAAAGVRRSLLARPLFPVALGACFGLGIAFCGAPGTLNYHFLSFFYGAAVAALSVGRTSQACARLHRMPARIVLALLLAALAWWLWRTRQDEFIPLLVRVDWRTLLLLTGVQVLGSLLLWSLSGAASGAPGGLMLPGCLLGRASLSFFLSWSLYGLVLGRSVHVFARQTPWTLLFLYASTLAASLLLTWFFFKYFEIFQQQAQPRQGER